jgi:hypothetical protein
MGALHWLQRFGFVMLILSTVSGHGADWVRAGLNTNQPVWGLRGGLQFAIPPGGFRRGDGGPRGLIRIGYPTLTNGAYDLINFIAVEPVVGSVRGFSELERSRLDGRPGKMFWTGESVPTNGARVAFDAGELSTLSTGVTQLTVRVRVEKFDNGAHVRLHLAQTSDAPDEVRIAVHAERDSAPMKSCIITATMGNRARARQLWLRDGAISSLEIFGRYAGADFTQHRFFPLERLPRTAGGDVLVAITTDEKDPAAAAGVPRGWQYRGKPVTQYWRKPAAGVNESLLVAVNARFTYWMSSTPIPGGLAYENFEVVEDFKDGQEVIFGGTRRGPDEIIVKAQ